MSKKRFRDVESGLIGKKQLVKLRLKAIRSGVWFRALPRIDRVLVDLTIRVAGSVRSFTLARNILVVVRKLEDIMESKFLRVVREIGFPSAERLCLIAQKWGNTNAGNWAFDRGFAKYLAAMSLNQHAMVSG